MEKKLNLLHIIYLCTLFVRIANFGFPTCVMIKLKSGYAMRTSKFRTAHITDGTRKATRGYCARNILIPLYTCMSVSVHKEFGPNGVQRSGLVVSDAIEGSSVDTRRLLVLLFANETQ
jgi:hypothetical protein